MENVSKKGLSVCESILRVLILTIFFFQSQETNSQWLNQPVTVHGADVYDLKFFDENTGLICATGGRIYRTTNGGESWALQAGYKLLYGMQKIDSFAIYGYGRRISNAHDIIYRSFNRGETWDSVAETSGNYYGICFINRDTGWISAFTAGPAMYRTTNGGLTLTLQSTQVGYGKVFFLPYKVNGEYIGWATTENETWRTINSGNNWTQVSSVIGSSYSQLLFINQYTGWAAPGATAFLKTTDGGYNWLIIGLPSDYGVIIRYLSFYDFINNSYDTLLGTGAVRYLGGGIYKGIIWKSTNSGLNWNFQQPDTSYPYTRYGGIDFINNTTGWSSNIKTTNAGGPVFVTAIIHAGNLISTDCILYQNYPNPFNSQTVLEFYIPGSSIVTLNVYNLIGQEVINIYANKYLESNKYKIDLNMKNSELPSGVYYYRLVVNDIYGRNIFNGTKSLIYIK